jgi:glycosyltransferase involved in cell wall biosynthesis
MKVALVYDRVNKWGGAERVLLTLHEMFPDAPLYTSVYNPETAPWANVFPDVITSFLQKISYARDRHEHFPFLMPLAFESFNFDEYDLVISVTSEAAKGIITKPQTKHICYCLTPTRYLWSSYEDYFRGPTSKIATKPVVGYLRRWDKIAAQRPDVMIAISTAVRDRIKKYYNRESEVIFPPVDLEEFKNQKSKIKNTNQILKFESFYLIVSRLVPYKRVNLAIETFNRLGLPLVIVGTGSEEKKLKNIAKSNIKFMGQLTEDDIIRYYRRCTAVIMPQEEDFGLVSVEAQAAGAPVIAFGNGGARDTVIPGKTGVFFTAQTVESLADAVERFGEMELNEQDSLENAKKFSKETFEMKFKKVVERL